MQVFFEGFNKLSRESGEKYLKVVFCLNAVPVWNLSSIAFRLSGGVDRTSVLW